MAQLKVSPKRIRSGRRLALLLVIDAAFGPAIVASAAVGQKTVLILYSTRQDTQLPIVFERELPPDTPVVSSATDRSAGRLANSTGVIVPLDLGRTLTLAMALQPGLWDVNRVEILAAVALFLAQTVLIVGLFVERARRREAEEHERASQAELRASYARIRDLGGRLLVAQESERSRIARELHDDIGQNAVALAIDLQRLGGSGPGRDPEVDRVAREAADRALGIAASVRSLSHRLHPETLRMIGVVAALERLRHELSHPAISIAFTHENVPAALPDDLALCLFRIAQEALQNAVKHSDAHTVSVQLNGGSQGLALRIVDDGVGFDVDGARGTGLGLISMRERLELLGGALNIQSRPGGGTLLEAVIPFSVADVTDLA